MDNQTAVPGDVGRYPTKMLSSLSVSHAPERNDESVFTASLRSRERSRGLPDMRRAGWLCAIRVTVWTLQQLRQLSCRAKLGTFEMVRCIYDLNNLPWTDARSAIRF